MKTNILVILNKGMLPLEVSAEDALAMLQLYFPRQLKQLLEASLKKAREDHKLSMGKDYKTTFVR